MQKAIKRLTDVRIWYCVAGLTVAVAAHEAFHIAAHIGHIEKIAIFPNAFTLVELTLDDAPRLLTHDAEEAIAYTITVLIVFLTIIDVFAITDSRDKRTTDQIIFPKKNKK